MEESGQVGVSVEESRLGNRGKRVVCPQSEQEVSELLRHADQKGLKVTVSGGGSKRGFGGRRETYDLEISMSACRGVVEHRCGDLTMTARAGTTIRELTEILSKEGQMLPCDPRWPDTATIGGVIAANETGPRRLRYGSPRDFVIGLRVVYPDGRIIRTGGKVVKNVAGYDMNKLFVGSMGTLGVITEVTVKLRPLPPSRGLVFLLFPPGKEEAIQPCVNGIQASVLEPCTLECLNPALTGELMGKTDHYALMIAFEDGEESVRAQMDRLRSRMSGEASLTCLGEDEIPEWWERWSRLGRQAAATVKIGTRNTDVTGLIREATELGKDKELEMWAHGGAGHGISRIYLDGEDEIILRVLHKLRNSAEKRGGYAVVDRISRDLRQKFDIWGDRIVHRPLLVAIKRTIDPKGTLNDGRFAGGL